MHEPQIAPIMWGGERRIRAQAHCTHRMGTVSYGARTCLCQQPGGWLLPSVLAEFVCDLQLHCQIQLTWADWTGATSHLGCCHP